MKFLFLKKFFQKKKYPFGASQGVPPTIPPPAKPFWAEGKPALFKQAKALEEERDYAKKKSPWIGYAGTAYQLAIVLLSASILAVSMPLFWTSFGVCAVGLLLMSQGLFLWF